MTLAEERAFRQDMLAHRCQGWLDADWQEHNCAVHARVQTLWWWRVNARFGVLI